METSLARMDEWSMEQALALCKALAESGYFKDVRNASQAFVKILYGRDLGISPIAAMRGIFVDERGGISLSAGLIAGKIAGSGRYTYKVIEATSLRCEIAFYREGELCGPHIVLTMAQAATSKMNAQWDSKAADGKGGYKEKITWKNYPEDMLFARCLTRGARRYCPDLFLGSVYVPDELAGDRAPAEVVEAEPVALQIEPPASEVEQREALGIEQPAEPPAQPAPTNGGHPAWYRGEPTGKQATVSGGLWQVKAPALAQEVAYYQKNGKPDFYHMCGAAGKCGVAVIDDANVQDVIAALKAYAAAQA